MSPADIVVLGLALSADAFAVTVSNSFAYAHESRRRLMLMPLFFGAFEALMPLGGYLLGGMAAELIERYSGVVTLVILLVIGGNMIKEGTQALRSETECPNGLNEDGSVRHLSLAQLTFQAVATAIDAFAVGISLRAQVVSLPVAVSVIGLTTFACCVVTLVIGRRLGCLLGERAEVTGGIVLVLIGVRAFVGL
ncbi:manganese efflux pump MntP family protein [Olsenella sp. HMSC062G07]|uniref:manganese efflux pump MntP n=1 Tax=Olsenella sp. HMSC062G07 TaxID=1739330 RepID=UPI0008A243C6|nr:manganese efflux pump MntP family protein [Olsenella sp. HMSC062G07]OFK23278.1 hypothetical protein HMPREF2826_05770 [Olsenella sp. HMSC062G07]